MRAFDTLSLALEYIETHIFDDMQSGDVAKYCYVSLSSLQKIFRYTFDYSIKEYISKRRLTLAARDLKEAESSIIEIALKYGYNSPENFTRAFRKVWHMTPSEYRRTGKFVEIFPEIKIEERGNTLQVYKDTAALYDLLQKNQDCFVICFDVVGLTKINGISRSLGDRVILEAVSRINRVREESMPLFRIGGDEFAMIAVGKDASFCRQAEDYIAKCNQMPLPDCKGEIPVMLRVWVGKNVLSDSAGKTSLDLIAKVKHAWD